VRAVFLDCKLKGNSPHAAAVQYSVNPWFVALFSTMPISTYLQRRTAAKCASENGHCSHSVHASNVWSEPDDLRIWQYDWDGTEVGAPRVPA
jgi:hypothetical protein